MIETLDSWWQFLVRVMTNEDPFVTWALAWIFTFAALQTIKSLPFPLRIRGNQYFKTFLTFTAILMTYAFIMLGGGITRSIWLIGLSVSQPLAYKVVRWYFNRRGWDFFEAGYVFGSAAPSKAAVASAVEAGKPIRGAVRNFYELSASGNYKRIDTERLRGLSKEQDE